MRKYLVTAIAVMFTMLSFGQKWTKSYTLPSDATATSGIEVINSQTVLAATSKGLYRTENAGDSWAQVHTTQGYLSCSGNTCYYLMPGSQIAKSTDGGKTWSMLTSPSINIGGLKAFAPDKVIVWRGTPKPNDSVFISYDGGNNWQKNNTPTAMVFRHFVTDSLLFYLDMEGMSSYLMRSNNQGKNTTSTGVSFNYTTSSVQYLNFINPKVGYAVVAGYPGDGPPPCYTHIYKTTDSGKTFKLIFDHTNSIAYHLRYGPAHFINEKTGWFNSEHVDIAMRLYKTQDSGKTWQADTLGLGNLGLTGVSNYKFITSTYGFALSGTATGRFILKYGESVPDSNTVKGRVYLDRNKNCQYDATVDLPLKNVVVIQKEKSFYGYTDANGNYEITPLLAGNHTLQLILPKDLPDDMQLPCLTNGERIINFMGSADTLTGLDFPIEADTTKPKPVVKVFIDRFRRCFVGMIAVSYKNESFATLSNAVVKIKMPEYVKFASADKPHTVDADGMYVFNVGTLGPLAQGTINITDSVVCGNEGIRGFTQCIEVYISGDGVNYKNDTVAWDKSESIVKARCMNGWINFQIINTTGDDMSDSAEMRLFSNAQQVDKRKYKLKAGDTLTFTIPANYTTYRMEADQTPGHPLSKYAQATIEGCEGEGAGTVSTGFVNLLPVNDFKFKKHVFCDLIRDSYDPNDKTVFPEGIGSSKFVKPGTQLTYRIRFQNTGTDTAFKVVVKDTLSADLDLATFSMGTASHPYTHVIKGTGKPVLEVTFNNINLPDSTTNNAGSNGFFTYTISHKGMIAQGTSIHNKADIFFDFNSAIRTNTATIIIKDTTETNPTHPPVIPIDKLPFILKNFTKDTVCKGDTVSIVIIGEGPYIWTKQGNLSIIGGTHELQIIADTTTTYIGRTKDGSESFTLLVKDCSTSGPDAVKEIAAGKIQVYPNPSASGVFYVTSQNPDEIRHIKIITLQGKQLMSATDNHTIDLSAHAAGIYFMVVETTAGDVFYQKLIKQ